MENTSLFLEIILFFINYINAKLIHSIFFSLFRFLTSVLQAVDVDILFLLNIKILLYSCGDIEINLGSKQSSFTFCRWNLNGLLLKNLLKIHYCRDILQKPI